jgi:hypothetical protein
MPMPPFGRVACAGAPVSRRSSCCVASALLSLPRWCWESCCPRTRRRSLPHRRTPCNSWALARRQPSATPASWWVRGWSTRSTTSRSSAWAERRGRCCPSRLARRACSPPTSTTPVSSSASPTPPGTRRRCGGGRRVGGTSWISCRSSLVTRRRTRRPSTTSGRSSERGVHWAMSRPLRAAGCTARPAASWIWPPHMPSGWSPWTSTASDR